jgi:cell wall-active antibiotic response 4TMS protein YvqF
MSDNPRCRCPRCTIRSLLGPAVIVTVGVLFLLQQMRGGYFDFGNTYPVILVVIGAILLASSLAPMDGHINPQVQPQVQQQVPPPPPNTPGPTTPQSSYQSPYPGQGQ